METFEVGLNAFCIMIITTSLRGKEVGCGSLNENGPHRLIYLNTWFQGGSSALGRIRMCATSGFEVF